MFWGCFFASGTGCLDCVNGIMKSEDYQRILERNVGPSVRKLGLRQRSWVFQQDKTKKKILQKAHSAISSPDQKKKPVLTSTELVVSATVSYVGEKCISKIVFFNLGKDNLK